jgi:hypothetical protein
MVVRSGHDDVDPPETERATAAPAPHCSRCSFAMWWW